MSGWDMNYRRVAMKSNQRNDGYVPKDNVVDSTVENRKAAHLCKMMKRGMTEEEYEKEYRRCKNLVPRVEKWVRPDPYDDIIINFDNSSSFASDDLDKPDSSDELNGIVRSDSNESDDDDVALSDDY